MDGAGWWGYNSALPDMLLKELLLISHVPHAAKQLNLVYDTNRDNRR